MSPEEFESQVQKSREITREDLATFLCLKGWTPENEAGTKFFFEGEELAVAYDLGTCNHDTCFVRDIHLYMEIREVLELTPVLSFHQVIDHIKDTLKSSALGPPAVPT